MKVILLGKLKAGGPWTGKFTVLPFSVVVIHGKYCSVFAQVSQLMVCVRRILFFPYGNGYQCASLYLEHGFEEPNKVPDGWYSCVQFGLVLWNPREPKHQISHSRLLLMVPWETSVLLIIRKWRVIDSRWMRGIGDSHGLQNYREFSTKMRNMSGLWLRMNGHISRRMCVFTKTRLVFYGTTL